MYRFLPDLKTGVFVATLGLIGLSAGAQTLQTEPDPSTQRGHALYKKTKIYDSKSGAKATKPQAVGDNALDRLDYEFNRLKNPYTNTLPGDVRESELNFAKKLPEGSDLQKSLSSAASSKSTKRFSNWTNRGPFNVGGRTRALAIDATNENVILAGGVSGGLWRSDNTGATWTKVTRRDQSPSITCIVQDTLSRGKRVWYYGSGERFGNSAGAGGAFFGGTGIFKSTNGGRTWRLLEATNDNDPSVFTPFDLINSIAINPTNGDIYVGTWNGVHRSQDEGNSFEEVLAGGIDNTAEVVITPSGRIYATIDSGGTPNAGFFTSTDGDNWTAITPEGFIPAYGRTVMGVDPSNENIVYFFTQSQTTGAQAALLYKYDASAETPEETWTDLSENLPFGIGGSVGNLNLQGGYNMVVKVHPTDPELVFVGGTNIYRSTTGFTTPTGQESWIAGYSPLNNVSLYTNQHPDQHAFLFYPSNPNRVLSGNDGGVYITEDITAENPGVEPVEWIDLNNGYITTQPYGVSFDPEANSDDLVAGFQDNGTWYTDSTNPTEPWEEDFGGDGAINAIADGGLTRYVSSQRGNIIRFNFDEEGGFVSFARVTPAGASGFSFIAPFILDKNNDNIMYLPAGNRIWRNSNLDSLPIQTNVLPTANWTELSNTVVSGTVTALDVSKFPVANRLYFGTSTGGVFRLDNANLDNQELMNISEGKGLPPGFVNDVNVDESDPDRVIITFSNYGIPSIFLTEDGGDTWTNISGNLEENADGTGNGPSVRSTAFFGASTGFLGSRVQKVFVATSVGLYYTNRLNGENTRWIKDRFFIGNAVTDEVKTRKDGFVALSAHGNGLFSARFPIINGFPESTLSVSYLLEDLTVDENSQDTIINVSGLFVQSSGLPIDVEITNSNPGLVTATLSGDNLNLSFAPDSIGEATIGLIASSNGEQVSEGFTVTIEEPRIYEQVDNIISSLPSQNFLDFGGLAQGADDFTIPQGNIWKVNRVLAPGGVNGAPALNNATIIIYADNGGVPGEEVYNSGEITPISDAGDSTLNLQLPEELSLESGTYWLSVYANLAFNPGGNQWFWSSQSGGLGQEPQWRDFLNLFGTGATDWTPASVALARPLLDQSFQIFGDIEDTDVQPLQSETAKNVSLASLSTDLKSVVWPNPSSDQFSFNFEALGLQQDIALQIFDISGREVHKANKVKVNQPYNWNASEIPAGFYVVKVDDGISNRSFKIIKN